MMTIRTTWADVFWLSLFCVIGHILLHGRQEVILEVGVDADIVVGRLHHDGHQRRDEQNSLRMRFEWTTGPAHLSRIRWAHAKNM